jgi:carbon monoxide dehydrogenase subunit G
MKFTCSIDINAPIEKVVKLWDNPENLKNWQDGFVSIETVSGTPGAAGAKSKITFQKRKT